MAISTSGNIATFISNLPNLGNSSFTITDTATNIGANFDFLNSNSSKISSINLVGSAQLSLSANQLINDNAALLKLYDNAVITYSGNGTLKSTPIYTQNYTTQVQIDTTSFPNWGTISISIQLGGNSGSASYDLYKNAVTFGGDANRPINSLANAYDVTPNTNTNLNYTFTNSPTDKYILGIEGDWGVPGASNTFTYTVQVIGAYGISLTGVNTSNLNSIISNGHVYSIGLTDTAYNISKSLNALQNYVTANKISSITVSDGQTLQLTQDQVSFSPQALQLITSNGGHYSLNQAVPTYALTPLNLSVNEGANAVFTLSTTNVSSGTPITYTLSGISSSDVVSGLLTGTIVIGSNGQATISIPIAADNLTEGPETLTVTAGGVPASILINDTSINAIIPITIATPVPTPVPTYVLSASNGSVNEGSVATFILSTTNVAAGTSVSYSLSGVSTADINGGSINGTVTIGSNGQATISIPIAADNLTEGPETLTVTAQGKSASIVINDTSMAALATYGLIANANSTNLGSTVTFTLNTTNVPSGTYVPYTISGVNSSELVNGQLSGGVVVGNSGQAVITIATVAHATFEGNKSIVVSTNGASATELLIDNAPPPKTYALTPLAQSLNLGSVASFTLSTTNVASGTVIPYTLTGVNPADLGTGQLTGSVTVGSTGQATIYISTASHATYQGNKTLTLNVNGVTARKR